MANSTPRKGKKAPAPKKAAKKATLQDHMKELADAVQKKYKLTGVKRIVLRKKKNTMGPAVDKFNKALGKSSLKSFELHSFTASDGTVFADDTQGLCWDDDKQRFVNC